jgi:glutaredoxin
MTDLLEKKKTKYDAVDMAQLEKGPRDEVYAKAGKRTLPLLFISGKFIGVLFLGG